jgi:hypothetical protein
LTKGTHTLKWTYNKRVADAKADDCVFLDNIVLPPFNIIAFVSPATNLKAEVDASNITLTWNASPNAKEYVIMRNDEQIAVVEETTYTDIVNQKGTYTYSVIAKKYDAVSEAVSVTVEVTELSIDDVNAKDVNIYPNPTTGVVYVDVETSFDAVIYNYQGQVVKRLYDNNDYIDMSDIDDGMYFLEVKTKDSIIVKKVLVK